MRAPLSLPAVIMIGLFAVSNMTGTPVSYNFVGTGAVNRAPGLPAVAIAFHLTVPAFIEPTAFGTFFHTPQFDSSTDVFAVGFDTVSVAPLAPHATELVFTLISIGAPYAFVFPDGSFTNPGVYSSIFGNGTATLTVSTTAAATATPEPSSPLLVGATLLLLAGGVARKYNDPGQIFLR